MTPSKKIALGLLVVLATVGIFALLQTGSNPPTGADDAQSQQASADEAPRPLDSAGEETVRTSLEIADEPLAEPVLAATEHSARAVEGSESTRATLAVRVFWEGDSTAATGIGARLQYDSGAAYGSLLQLGVTDRDGNLRIDDLTIGRATVILDRGTTREVELIAGLETRVEIALPAGITTDVFVEDELGVAVWNADVWRVPEHRSAAVYFMGRTDASGRLRCQGLRLDDALVAFHADYQPSAETMVCVSTRECVTRLTLVEGETTRLIGRVVSDADDKPIANAFVSIGTQRKLKPGPGGSMAFDPGSSIELRTTANGDFASPPLSRGGHRLRVVAKNFVPAERSLDDSAGRPAVLEIRMTSGARIEGSVRDASGRACADAYVTLDSSAAYSDASGRYVLTGLSRNGGKLYASHATAGRAEFNVPTLSSDVRVQDIVLSLGNVIRGRLMVEDYKGLAGWYVCLGVSDGTRGLWKNRALTEADGSFVLTNCAVEGNRLEIHRQEAAPRSLVKEVKDVAANGPPLTIVVAETEFPAGFINGRLTGLADGQRHPSLTLEYEDERNRMWVVRYGIDGSFRIGPLRAGEFRLLLQCSDEAPGEVAKVHLLIGQTHDLGDVHCP